MKFTITGNPISSKNSRPIFINKTTGSRFIGKSKALKDYMDRGLWELKQQFKYRTPITLTGPIQVTFTLFVKDNRNYDLCNLCQAPLDLLKMANIIADDNYKIVPSLDGSRIYIDKENARTEIELKIIQGGTMTFETNKAEAVEEFINRIMPFWAANNSMENMKIYLSHESKKFYSDAFVDGQENVLKEQQ